MMATQQHYTYWVCEDCYLTHAGYDEHELGRTLDREPLSRIPVGAEVTAGLMADEHDGDCPNFGEWIGAECDCEHRDFTWSDCDGCGSSLGGSRDALTVWEG